MRRKDRQLRRAQRGEIPAGSYLVDHLQEQIEHDVELGDSLWRPHARAADLPEPAPAARHSGQHVGADSQMRHLLEI